MPDFPAYDVLRVMQQGKFGTPSFSFVEGGGSSYAQALRVQSPGVQFESGAAVRRLRRDAAGWWVQRDSGEEGPFEQVIVATPAFVVEALLGGHPLARVEHRHSFRHLIVDGQSRTRQLEIARLQGQEGVFLAGMYTCDVDNHESVALSAMTLAERLSPESPQLALLRAALGGGLQRR